MSDFEALCACGHIRDEHDPRYQSCEVEDCDCIHFENADDPGGRPVRLRRTSTASATCPSAPTAATAEETTDG